MARNILGMSKNVSDGFSVQTEDEQSEEKKQTQVDLNSDKEKQTGAIYAHYTFAVDAYSRQLEEEKRLKREISQKVRVMQRQRALCDERRRFRKADEILD